MKLDDEIVFLQVLVIINAEEDVLDDKGVIEALKEAKAEVFETLNDLTAEKKTMTLMEKNVPQFKKVNFQFVFVEAT